MSDLPEKVYLESNVMPALMKALEAAAIDKPEDALTFIGQFMLKQQEQIVLVAKDNGPQAQKLKKELPLQLTPDDVEELEQLNARWESARFEIEGDTISTDKFVDCYIAESDKMMKLMKEDLRAYKRIPGDEAARGVVKV